MADKASSPAAQGRAAPTATPAVPLKVEFPHELRRHFYETADWTSIIFMAVSVSINLLAVTLAASYNWQDPTANLTNEQLLALQDHVVKAFKVEIAEPPQEVEDLPDISNPDFEQALQQQQDNLAASLQSTLADAQRTLAELDKSFAQQAAGAEAAGAQDQMADLMASLGSMGDLGSLGAEDLSGPALDIAPTDVAIFAEGAGGSRVVSGAIDIAALGSNAQISAQFTSGGLSQAEASRLSSQIQFARERLGSSVQLRVSAGLGGDRRAALRVATGGRTGQRIAIEQLALPPARAAGPGGRDQDAVDAQAARTRNFIGGCYTIGLAADPSLSGLVVIRFTIQRDGTVTNVQVSKSNLGNRDVESCVVATVQTWKFAAGGSVDTFEYPFTFEPG